MSGKIVKYNPSFLNDQELIDSFVVRHGFLELLLEVIRENTHQNNQHVIAIGPRGSGKTTLLRRVIAEIRQQKELSDLWYPLPFGEESYEIASAGEFWLEALHHLGGLTGDPSWGKAYDELLGEHDEKRLQERCLSRLLDFADKCGKRLLLVVENLNLMLGEQLEDIDAWALRETLMHEPRIMLLGSATASFAAITDQNQAMFELFRVFHMSRLTVEECQKVWSQVAGQDITEKQARAVQILTGGNPRLLTILSLFGSTRSFRSLMDDLSLLVDEHTDYFKSNFESLPPKERKVFACLASLWEDSLSSEIARAARMTTSQVSAQLKRLESRGCVRVVSNEKGKKRYQLAERLYNIYYLMRRSQNDGRVKAVVYFMRQFYGQERLHEAMSIIASEACQMKDGERQDHYRAFQIFCNYPEAKDKLQLFREAISPAFRELPDLPDSVKKLLKPDVKNEELFKIAKDINKSLNAANWNDAEEKLRRYVELDSNEAKGWGVLGERLVQIGQSDEGIKCLRKAIELAPNLVAAWFALGGTLIFDLNRQSEGYECLKKAAAIEQNIFCNNPYLLNKIRSTDVSMETLENILNSTNRPGDLLNNIACAVMDKMNKSDYEDMATIVAWARESVEKTDGEKYTHGTLARALALQGNILEALPHVQTVLADIELVNNNIQEMTDILTLAAAFGHGQEALDLLVASPSLNALEPVAVGLKQYLGLDVQAPQEVKEIGEDIVKNIEMWKEKRVLRIR
ncbi:AAA family ATPase [Desulfovibrio gilichinskyi]|uniref:Tetratricopeptide repeat-containing protein n=1 Tax=Desulfovibrio gilichinskyi TaxID=1519643 RepID=A0A1X7CT93_9BACT|nr:AAA family ATPase [Desulfovibrio gilichinskyi]SMF02794.1 Tetratricopeptide repeat-containing protein [Desulfovibrio gilichinskyi]